MAVLASSDEDSIMALTEYPAGQAFPGVIGRTFDVSTPAWPAPRRAKQGAPNVLFIVFDDTGFGHLGCYGSPINTPNINALEAGGLLYTNMHTTALCSPSRTCFITGRNHHSNGMACGEYDNTLIMLVSDNGSSPEGGPTGSVNENKFFTNVPDDLQKNLAAIEDIGGPKYFNHFPWGWTHAGNTPFRRWKRETYRGGVSDPFLISWPGGMKARGEVRTQYCHAIDLVPTVLDCLGIEPPTQFRGITQSPIQGFSLKSSFDDARAEALHKTQYFEMFGHRSLYHDGWRAVCPWPGTSFTESGRGFGDPLDHEILTKLDAEGWELYDLTTDPAETKDLADRERARLIEMIGMWYAEAGKFNVLPIDSRGTLRLGEQRPQIAENRSRYVYYPGTQVVPGSAGPRLLNTAHSVSVHASIPDNAQGALFTVGGNDGGFVIYLKDGKLVYGYNYVADQRFRIESTSPVPTRDHVLSIEFAPTGKADVAKGKGTPGTIKLLIDGENVGEGELPVTIPLQFGLAAGITIGSDNGSPVMLDDEYKPPFAFTGTIHKALVDVTGEALEDKEEVIKAYLKMALARQ